MIRRSGLEREKDKPSRSSLLKPIDAISLTRSVSIGPGDGGRGHRGREAHRLALGTGVDIVVGSIAFIRGGATRAMIRGRHNRRGGPRYRDTLNQRIERLKAEGHEHLGGGALPKEVVDTPNGLKTCRYPDITTRAPDGSIYRENVGSSKVTGEPSATELRALDDIEEAVGTRPGFTPYDQ